MIAQACPKGWTENEAVHQSTHTRSLYLSYAHACFRHYSRYETKLEEGGDRTGFDDESSGSSVAHIKRNWNETARQPLRDKYHKASSSRAHRLCFRFDDLRLVLLIPCEAPAGPLPRRHRQFCPKRATRWTAHASGRPSAARSTEMSVRDQGIRIFLVAINSTASSHTCISGK